MTVCPVNVGKWYEVKNGNFKGAKVKILKIYDFKQPRSGIVETVADVQFPAGNKWQFALKNLKEITKTEAK